MSGVQKIELPDIGDFDEVEIIEILVNVGDTIDADDSMITLESDKASMEIPSPASGIIKEIHVALGDKVSQGSLILSIEGEESGADNADETTEDSTAENQTSSEIIAVNVPDIGDFDAVEVIEILANIGDELDEEDSVITLESDVNE